MLERAGPARPQVAPSRSISIAGQHRRGVRCRRGSAGQIDVLVNNAGRALIRPAIEVTREDWDALINVNLTGTFFLTQQFGRHAIAQRSGGRSSPSPRPTD